MKILVIGGGGREHAILDTINRQSPGNELFCAPGNAGIAQIAACIPKAAEDLDGICGVCAELKPDLVIVAPDDPLSMGMVDRLESMGIRAFGPRKNAAEIEYSKSFAKELMRSNNIPTAPFEVFEDCGRAVEYIKKRGAPIVIKADGLARGKGVVVAKTVGEAEKAVKNCLVDAVFGGAGSRVVIEDCLTGPEVSVLCFTDGKTVVPMVSAQDHKRAFDGDEGPNTGGMGAFSPSRYYTPEIAKICEEKIYKPTVAAMNALGRPFSGVLYFGLMLTPDGPSVIEYNARFGDPEAQAVLVRLKTPLLDIIGAIIDGKLDKINVEWDGGAAAAIVLASGGYPDSYEKGMEITGMGDVVHSRVFHAGTAERDGKFVTAGGRVLAVTAAAESLERALEYAYADAKRIGFKGMFYRRDIGRV